FKDGDPLDIMALSYEPLEIGCLVKVKVIGAILLEDEKGEDPKILSVPISDQRFKGYNDIQDVHPNKLKEIQEFFEIYKRLEPHKWVKFKGWKNAKEAMEIVAQAIENFKEKFGSAKI
ncbi:MAG: inorganic diphosphatase, partial [Candidatus Aenigmatarchaeota archaeon]